MDCPNLPACFRNQPAPVYPAIPPELATCWKSETRSFWDYAEVEEVLGRFVSGNPRHRHFELEKLMLIEGKARGEIITV